MATAGELTIAGETSGAVSPAGGVASHRSIRFRFTASLVINVSRAALSFLVGIVVARALGPANFGSMTFLLATFTAIASLMDMGSANAFFTFISQRPRGRRFVLWYFGWQLTQYLLLLAAIGVLLPRRWVDLIWVGQPRVLILAALTAFFLQQQLWQTSTQIGFSIRSTIVQVAGLVVVVVHLSLVLLAWWLNRLTVGVVLALLSLEYLVAALIVWTRLRGALGDAPEETPRYLLREYWAYCAPLAIYCWFGFVFPFADNWMLQRFGGNTQQGYYAVAMQFSTISMFATVSMLQIFWKEVAEAHARGDAAQVERLCRKVSRLLYGVAAAVGGFLIPWSAEIVSVTLGPGYAAGVPIVRAILLYPLHQTMGQVISTMFFATAQTKAQVRLGIVSSIVTLPFSYFVLAPPDGVIPGLGLGALGSAIKLLTTTVVAVNAISWWFCRMQGWKFDWVYQIQGPLAAGLVGFFAYGIAQAVMHFTGWPLIGGASIGLICYVACAAVLAWRFPDVLGLSRQDFDHVHERLTSLRLW